MDKNQWKQYIIQSVNNGNGNTIDTLAVSLEELDKAKQVLRDKGYGCLGMGILETASLVSNLESDRPMITEIWTFLDKDTGTLLYGSIDNCMKVSEDYLRLQSGENVSEHIKSLKEECLINNGYENEVIKICKGMKCQPQRLIIST